MAQTGYTPIQLYYSTTASTAPLAANLANGELAINITDGKLFYKDNAAAVQVIGWKTVPATAGGTGQTSYTTGDLLYASSSTALSKLADVATGNALISGGVGAAPAWGKIGLTTHISGVLPVANGGTNISSYAVGDLIYASGTTTLASLADVATGNALISGGVGVAPSWGKIGLTTHVSGTLPVANGGTGLTSVPHTVTIYTSGSGTYTTPANCKALYIRMVGGGGNGGGSTGTTAGGGGGAGGYLEVVISSPSASYTYAVGAAGGNTTFNASTYSANAGTAGTSSSATASGGAGGTASGGNLNMTGATGGFGWASSPYFSGGYGAGSPFGSGGSGGGTGSGNGFNGVVFGSGGGGAVGGGAAGNGVGGLIVITEVYV